MDKEEALRIARRLIEDFDVHVEYDEYNKDDAVVILHSLIIIDDDIKHLMPIMKKHITTISVTDHGTLKILMR